MSVGAALTSVTPSAEDACEQRTRHAGSACTPDLPHWFGWPGLRLCRDQHCLTENRGIRREARMMHINVAAGGWDACCVPSLRSGFVDSDGCLRPGLNVGWMLGNGVASASDACAALRAVAAHGVALRILAHVHRVEPPHGWLQHHTARNTTAPATINPAATHRRRCTRSRNTRAEITTPNRIEVSLSAEIIATGACVIAHNTTP